MPFVSDVSVSRESSLADVDFAWQHSVKDYIQWFVKLAVSEHDLPTSRAIDPNLHAWQHS